MDYKFNEIHLREYALRRNFSKSLTETCIYILKKSLQLGDGGLWSNSLFVHLIENNLTTVSESYNLYEGIRGKSILERSNFERTLSMSNRTYPIGFQKPLDIAITNFNFSNPKVIIDEKTLVQIELNEALENVGYNYLPFIHFINELTEIPSNNNIDIAYTGIVLKIFCDQFLNILLLSHFCKIHPFTFFINGKVNYRTQNQLSSICLSFLIRLRDSCNISEKFLPISLLVQFSNRWNEAEFQLMNEEIEYSTETRDMISYRHNSHCNYIAELITNNGLPLELFLHDLENKNNNSTLKPNESVLIHLDTTTQKLKINNIDFYGEVRINPENKFKSIKSRLGFSSSNPIWNNTIIENFEFLINKKNVSENEFQKFFEAYPELLMEDLHISASPQILLINEEGRKLKPDFILQRVDNYIDILEIKLPSQQELIRGKGNRITPKYILSDAIQQLKEYQNFFYSNSNRSLFKNMYGLEGYEPVVSLLIGRKNSFGNAQVIRKIMKNEQVNLLTYDDILERAKLRNNNLKEL